MDFERKPYVREVPRYSKSRGPIIKVNTKKLLKTSRLNNFIDNIDYIDRIKHLPVRKDLYLNELVKRYKQKISTDSTRANNRMSRIEIPPLTPYKGSVNFYMIRNDPTRNYRDIKKELTDTSPTSSSPRNRRKNMSRLSPISPNHQSYSMMNSLFLQDKINYNEVRYGTPNCLQTLPRIISSPCKTAKTDNTMSRAEFSVVEFKETRQHVLNMSPLKVLKEELRETFQDSDSDDEWSTIKPWEVG